jgi:hypothetical protein
MIDAKAQTSAFSTLSLQEERLNTLLQTLTARTHDYNRSQDHNRLQLQKIYNGCYLWIRSCSWMILQGLAYAVHPG